MYQLHCHSNKLAIMLIFVLLLAVSCGSSEEHDEGRVPVARVYDEFLYADEIEGIFHEGASKQDSLEKLRSYVNSWSKKRLLKKKAELNLTEEQSDVEQQLEEYRTSLLINKYKEKLIVQKLDTTISEEQLKEFYEKRESDFKLKNPVVKAVFIILPINSPNIAEIKARYLSDKEKDISFIKEFCYLNANRFDDFNNNWIYFNDILKELPLKITDPNDFLAGKQKIELKDEENVYFVRIKEARLKGENSPLIFVRNRVQSYLLFIRKRQLMSQLENDLYNDAFNDNDLEFYYEINK